ncbi:Arc-like DNA binding domain-containing protein [Azotobacter beijerinckii]|uniref:Arc-like DNA binding domain-containing protein n=1 Tax=Azotobacter beijerinckii TaxID=170623 RepID=A0A1H6UHL0_9GAMM|nr:Arc family DNA-binding protein [Azotobacter beijerinckii]SEI91206.1 Arc-like DNA binding domain-containing protein [Azotobacter beijerinckii]SEQ90004.1 Arc-like DNA binding domain-containing protein [Azotobacter beijerinckii]
MADSRQLDKFIIRLPDGMRERISDAALKQHTSMNSLVIKALEEFLDGQQRQQLLLDALSEQIKRLEHGKTPA